MNCRCEEQVLIKDALRHWALVKKKIKVIRMMGSMGGQKVLEMRERRMNKEIETIPDAEQPCSSKLIIPPNNWWNMQWNNFVTTAFVVYIFIFPIYISYETKLTAEQLNILLIFDLLFMIDRVADLFAGYYK